MSMNKRKYQVVGHRGFPQNYPENSLVGIAAAAKAGVDCVELDVQLSKDGVLMVFHDETLDRVTSIHGPIGSYTEQQLTKISCHEPERFGDKYNPTPIASLREVCLALSQYDVHVFVEVKEQVFTHIDRSTLLEKLKNDVEPLANYSLISFDYDVLSIAKQSTSVGWVVRDFDERHRQRAELLLPNILIADVKKLDENSVLWQGPWEWFLYDIVDPKVAHFWNEKGVRYIETWDLLSIQ